MALDSKLIKERDRRHYELALKAWGRLHEKLKTAGVEHVLFGSLKTGGFKAHSDIDVMIVGEEVEEAQDAISEVYREFGDKIKIDYIFAMYLPEERVRELLND